MPELLRAAVSADENESQYAIEEIINNLNHQGSVYPASAYAVPHMLDAASLAHHHRWVLVAAIGQMADSRESDDGAAFRVR